RVSVDNINSGRGRAAVLENSGRWIRVRIIRVNVRAIGSSDRLHEGVQTFRRSHRFAERAVSVLDRWRSAGSGVVARASRWNRVEDGLNRSRRRTRIGVVVTVDRGIWSTGRCPATVQIVPVYNELA